MDVEQLIVTLNQATYHQIELYKQNRCNVRIDLQTLRDLYNSTLDAMHQMVETDSEKLFA